MSGVSSPSISSSSPSFLSEGLSYALSNGDTTTWGVVIRICFVRQDHIFIVLALQGPCSKDLWIAVETTKTDITREEVHDGIWKHESFY